ncbi:endo-beta-N-acetylglucosaminidase [Streptococcus sp. DD13]|uniref:endo-beta-N-acetylglucosaminidase n=1 Tax=Streptococcus sp. DD13 TaxID=1777881 RepID=UPI00079AED3F|nr:bacterial Ig-like domain-containing protein [Streptococcus sp. DD13]KXT77893.1 Cell wall-associated murein hydrolase LytC [Streptococcus sp. DD13]
MKGQLFEKRSRFSIRKYTVGVCSVLIGAFLLGAPLVSADDAVASEVSSTVVEGDLGSTNIDEVSAQDGEETPLTPQAESSTTIENGTSTSASTDEELVDKEVVTAPSTIEGTGETGAQTGPAAEEPRAVEEKAVADSPVEEEKSIRPKEVKFETWTDLLNWQPGAREDDAINRASVALAERYRGTLVNQQANPDAKVQALSNMNSKAKDHASVGGEEFKAYAFDYWQYLDSMVFWEGLVPSPDVIDAAHRNGVPIYGTLFYNWSDSLKDQERFVESLKEDSEGSKTFPIARKLVDLAKYYGFDGYFINQETTGRLVKPLGPKMRDFMLYTKEYARSVGYPIQYSWYDAMTYEYGRYHENALGEYNYQFMEKNEKGDKPVDTFFANFNWNKADVDYSINTADYVKRSQYDVLAGLELQRGGSYLTNVDWDAILDANGKLRLSLGLYAPDTITGLGKTGDGYHKHEDIFWTGYQGDPTKGKPGDKSWYGLANLIADRTVIISPNFSTSFNTGHGKKWFVDGVVSKDGEWNYRSVSGILPTWRWWIQHAEGTQALKGGYDFDQAYNGGNSIAFSGKLEANSNQHVMLYSTKIAVQDTSRLSLVHKGGLQSEAYVTITTDPEYKTVRRYKLSPSDDWQAQTFDLSDLKGQTIYSIGLHFNSDQTVDDFQFHLGQLSVYSQTEKPAAPSQVSVKAKRLQNAQEAEAIIHFQGSEGADYYEVYEQDGDGWRIVTGSSGTTVYLAKLSRSAQAQGTKQTLKVVAVGKNGLRSDAGLVDFDWGMTTGDTTLPRALAPNVVLGAKVIDSSFPKSEGSEGMEGMLNGTITSLSDKWSSAQLSGTVDIRLTQPRTIVRWAMDHAGAGGESVDDGKMNTRDFDLYYKDADNQWKLAKAIRGNRAHVTDVTLDKPITAQEWRLHVITADNGTPWQAIRIYNWRMYESLDTETVNVPMKHAAVRDLGDGYLQVGFKDVAAKTTVFVYDAPTATKAIGQGSVDEAGDLVLAPIHFDKKPNLLYYRAQTEGKELSNILAISVPEQEKTIASVSLEQAPTKTSYTQGEDLQLEGGLLRVRYQNGLPDELIQLTNTAVVVTGYKANDLGEQNLTVSYLGKTLDKGFTVQVEAKPDEEEKTVQAIGIASLPKTEYTVGENLDLSEGRLKVTFEDGSSEELSMEDQEVYVFGYDKSKEGRQTVTLLYRDQLASFEVLVSPKAALNDEYLKQKLAEAEKVMEKPIYSFASHENKLALEEAVTEAQLVLEEHETSTQAQVNERLNILTEALDNLDGEERFKEAVLEMTSLTAQAQEKQAHLPNHPAREGLEKAIAQVKTLLEKDSVTPEELADAKTSLEKAIAALDEEKRIIFKDDKTGIEVHFSAKEPIAIKGLKVDVLSSETTKNGRLFDIEAVDADGQDIDLQYASLVRIPIEEGREVEKVLFLPENQPIQELSFEVVEGYVVFTAPHFTHYTVVYKALDSTTDKPQDPADKEISEPNEIQSPKKIVPLSTKPLEEKKATKETASEQTLPETGEKASSHALALAALGLLSASLLLVSTKKEG